MNLRNRHLFCALFMTLVAAAPSGAQTAQDAFDRGITLYRDGNYQAAAGEFESILKPGYRSAALYFNLGNSYYRAGRLGSAILAYERARRLEPNDPDIIHNLKLTNLRTIDRIDAVPEFFLVSWMRSLASLFSSTATTSALLLSWASVFFSLSILLLVRREIVLRTTRIILLISTLVVIVTGSLLAVQTYETASREEAIVVGEVVTAKNSPDEQAVNAFVIHEGLKVRLSDAVGDWVKITLADGKVGWVSSTNVERI